MVVMYSISVTKRYWKHLRAYSETRAECDINLPLWTTSVIFYQYFYWESHSLLSKLRAMGVSEIAKDDLLHVNLCDNSRITLLIIMNLHSKRAPCNH